MNYFLTGFLIVTSLIAGEKDFHQSNKVHFVHQNSFSQLSCNNLTDYTDNNNAAEMNTELYNKTNMSSKLVTSGNTDSDSIDKPVDKPNGRMEFLNPDELEEILKSNPVAYVPLGTYEHHGWHLPVGFDGIKAHALCELASRKTGGAVLPTFFYGTGGGHSNCKFSVIIDENLIVPIIEITLDRLAGQGFKVIVLLSGHYPNEQIDMVHRLAKEAQLRFPDVRFIGLTEYEITTPFPGDPRGGDHAAKYETSIAMFLNTDWVAMDRLTSGRDPLQVTLPEGRKDTRPSRDPDNPLYAIGGQDPRTTASVENGEIIVKEVISRLSAMVEIAFAEVGNEE